MRSFIRIAHRVFTRRDDIAISFLGVLLCSFVSFLALCPLFLYKGEDSLMNAFGVSLFSCSSLWFAFHYFKESRLEKIEQLNLAGERNDMRRISEKDYAYLSTYRFQQDDIRTQMEEIHQHIIRLVPYQDQLSMYDHFELRKILSKDLFHLVTSYYHLSFEDRRLQEVSMISSLSVIHERFHELESAVHHALEKNFVHSTIRIQNYS